MEIVACRSTVAGTHRGAFIGLTPMGGPVKVQHMHFMRVVNGKNTDLWHLWDTPKLMEQLGAAPRPAGTSA